MANLNVTVNTDYNGRGIREAQAAMTDLSNKTITQLQDRIKRLNELLRNVNPNSQRFTNFAAEVNRSTAALRTLQGRVRTIGNVIPTSMGGATSSVIEFNRVIQDAPFGIQGFGNNIQALTQNFGYLVNQTGSARRATSVFFSTLITPANLAVLAVSALTSAWTVYNSIQQKNNKAAAEAAKNQRTVTQEIDDQVDSLSALDRVNIKASSSAAEESIKLRTLYGITQDLTFSIGQRNRAADQLQKLYPEYFKNQTNEAILTGNAANAYDRLSQSIIATSKARAAVDISADNSKELLKIQLERNSRQSDEVKLQEKINQLKKEALKLGAGQGEIDSVGSDKNFFEGITSKLSQPLPLFNGDDRKKAQVLKELYDTEQEILQTTDQRTKAGVREIQLTQEQTNLQKILNDQIKKGADITGKPGADFSTKPKAERNDVIKDALQKSTDATGVSGLKDAAKQLVDLEQEYQGYYRTIDKYVADNAKNGKDVTTEAENAKTILVQQQAQRRAGIEIAESQRISDELQRIRDDSGVASEQTAEKEYAGVVKWYNAEVIKAQGNSDILQAIEEGAQARRDAIRQKYQEKYEASLDKLMDKIKAVEDQNFTQNKTGLAADTKKLQDEIDKRIAKVNDLYDALDKVSGGSVFGFNINNILRSASVANVKGKGAEAQNSTDYQSAKALNAAVADFTNKMFDSLSNIGKKNSEITDKYNKARAGATDAEIVKLNAMERQEKVLANNFGTIFSSIFETFTNSMNSLFKTTLSNLLKTSFSKGLDDLKFGGLSSKVSGAIVAGAALAGNAISSIGGGKNTVTSALGGALTGAASGAVLGTALGPGGTLLGGAIGGLAGAISGIFGSSSKRKQEQLEEQQLAEQKKTNALLDRQSRLAYSSQIVGRMTDRGVISGVDVNEFGQLTTTIQGQDIVVSYDRTKKSQSRGT